MIDIPIGLPTSGRRACDSLARGELGSKRASIFFAPTRGQVLAEDYDAVRGEGVSLQSFYLFRKIREVDRLIEPTDQSWLREAHPELAFFARTDSHLGKKRSPQGVQARQALLERIGSPFRLGEWEKQFLRRDVGLDDLLDAAVLLEVARGQLLGNSRIICADERDERGLRMEICY